MESLQDRLTREAREKIDERFPLSFFATKDWQYNSNKKPSEWQFRSWQENETNKALTKAEMFKAYTDTLISHTISETIKAGVREIEGEVRECPNHDPEEAVECYGYDENYNQALQTAVTKLQELQDKK